MALSSFYRWVNWATDLRRKRWWNLVFFLKTSCYHNTEFYYNTSHCHQVGPAVHIPTEGRRQARHQKGGREVHQMLPFTFYGWALATAESISTGDIFPKTLVSEEGMTLWLKKKNTFSRNEQQLLSFRPRNSLLTAARISWAQAKGKRGGRRNTKMDN